MRNMLLGKIGIGILASLNIAYASSEVDGLIENLVENGKVEEIRECGIEGRLYSQRRFLQKVGWRKYDASVVSFMYRGDESYIGGALIDTHFRTASIYHLLDGGENYPLDGKVDRRFRLRLRESEMIRLLALAKEGFNCEVRDSHKSYLEKASARDQRVYDEIIRMNSQ